MILNPFIFIRNKRRGDSGGYVALKTKAVIYPQSGTTACSNLHIMAVLQTRFELNLLGWVLQPAAADCNGRLAHFKIYIFFYATLPYIRHFISAGCYDNDPWYLGTNLRGI
jgi:hypothetical protein